MAMNPIEETECTDIVDLFRYFNAKHFKSSLDCCEVKWSPRMTLCAGLCCYDRGGYCVIKLSEPLLKFRPRSDMINTLLHEMIHASLFVTGKNTDRDDHGPRFCALMNQINEREGTGITVYHSFHGEVEHYRLHWWKCNKCQNVVKRTMNRAPGKSDPWWADHTARCGGDYVKVREPTQEEKEQVWGRKAKKLRVASSSKQTGSTVTPLSSSSSFSAAALSSSSSSSSASLAATARSGSEGSSKKTIDSFFPKVG
eukprot:ANDGO_00874.mRNA.1 SprT-like domain-containing protein Spartan